MTIENITDLGLDVVEIANSINSLVDEYSCVEINGIGVVDSTNKDVVINTINSVYKVRTQLRAYTRSFRKLNYETELKLIKDIKKGYSRERVAAKYDISVATVSRIMRRHNAQLPIGRPKNSKNKKKKG